MASTINPMTAVTDVLANSNASPKPPADEAAVNKEMFLKLLVAQIQNQNPLKPVDGIEFLSQLATLTSVEQLAAVRGELETIRKSLTEPADQAGGNGSSTAAAPAVGQNQIKT